MVAVRVHVAVGVQVGVSVKVGVAVRVKVWVTVGVLVMVGLGVGVGVTLADELDSFQTPPPKVPTYVELFPKLTCWMELKGMVVTRAQLLPSFVDSKRPWFSVP